MVRITVLIAIILGVATGYLFKGRLNNLANLNFRGLVLLVSSLALRFILFREFFLESSLASQVGSFFYNLSNFLALAFLALNLSEPGVKLIFAGTFSNTLAILLNGGRMPTSLKALKLVNQEDLVLKITHYGWYPSSLANLQTKLSYLGDVIPFRFPIRALEAVISAGDILILAGFFILIVKGMQTKA